MIMQANELTTGDNKLHILAYSVSDEVEDELKKSLELILSEYDLMSLHHAIYTCLKELLMNAIKANFKNIYFEDYTSKNKSEKTISYDVAIKLFMLEMTREEAKNLERIAKKRDIKAVITMWIGNDFLHFSCHNPVPMTDIEQKNIQKKLKVASKINDISEYFMEIENDPNKEGAGLGLVLITLMLKGIIKQAESIKINSDSDSTTAYLKIPLNKDLLNEESI